MPSASVVLERMKVMNKSLQQRIVTAVILLIALLAVTMLLPPMVFSIAIAIVVLLVSWEWSRLIGLERTNSRLLYVSTMLVMLLGAFVLLGVTPGAKSIDVLRASLVLMLGLLWWLLAFVILKGYPDNTPSWNDRSRIGLMGLLALVPTWVGVVLLKFLNPEGYLVISLIILVAAVDVGAYFAGTYFGRRKLAPALSPNKSWEGVIGGLFTCLLVGAGFIAAAHRYLAPLNLSQVLVLVLLCFITTYFAVVGDLVESMLKRNSKVKDSGQLLPGHGGFMDRVDGLVAVTPAYVLILVFTLFEME